MKAWPNIRFLELGPGPDASVLSGSEIPVRTFVDLAGLSPSDVRVEAVVGRVGVNGTLEDTEVLPLPAVEQHGSAWVFRKEIVPHQTGRLGYALRISPNHDDNPLTRRCNSLIKWGVE
jgi:starch phosphorylase